MSIVAGVVAVGALVYLLREKGRAAPVDGLAWGGWSSVTNAVSNVASSVTNAVSSVASQAANVAKQAAAEAVKVQQAAQQKAADASRAALLHVQQAELAARNAAQAAASEAQGRAALAAKTAYETSKLVAMGPKTVISAPGSVVNNLREAVSSVSKPITGALKNTGNLVMGTIMKGAVKLRIVKVPEQPGQPPVTQVTDENGNPYSHDALIDQIVAMFKLAGDPAAANEMAKNGLNASDIAEGRAKWIAMGSPRDGMPGGSGPTPSSDPGIDAANKANREAYIASMLPWFKARGEGAAGELSAQGVLPADIAEARSKWIAMGSPRDPAQRSDDTGMVPKPAVEDWKNPYQEYLNKQALNPPGGGGSSGGSGGGGSSGGGSWGSGGGSSGGGASADVVNNMRAADAAAPKGKLNPVLVVGAAAAAPFVMHFMGGK